LNNPSSKVPTILAEQQETTAKSRTKLKKMQCFPYEAVTGKIYHLKQQFLPPATSLRFTKTIKVVLKNTGQELSLTC